MIELNVVMKRREWPDTEIYEAVCQMIVNSKPETNTTHSNHAADPTICMEIGKLKKDYYYHK